MSLKKKSITKEFNTVLTILFVLGIFFTIYSINLFSKTFVHWFLPFSIYFLSGLLTTIIIFKYWNIYFVKTSFIFQFFINSISVGGLTTFILLNLNFIKTSIDKEIRTFKILEKRYMFNFESSAKYGFSSTSHVPIVVINIGNRYHKNLIFNDTEKREIGESDNIRLVLKTGIFGYKVINSLVFVPKESKTNIIDQILRNKKENKINL